MSQPKAVTIPKGKGGAGSGVGRLQKTKDIKKKGK